MLAKERRPQLLVIRPSAKVTLVPRRREDLSFSGTGKCQKPNGICTELVGVSFQCLQEVLQFVCAEPSITLARQPLYGAFIVGSLTQRWGTLA